ncbi:MAG: alpha/beta fold hydrolase [Betaproteobacteria bacterium]|nr:alpha/beta fold hydrolase [Betaproteobacteria bacterium]
MQAAPMISNTPAVVRSDIEFMSQGVKCAAWLYRPQTAGVTPCVVMAHGFSAVREQRLDAYAERFAEAGMAVLLFDYRYFGASEGKTRQLLSIRSQLQDWEAAVATARALPNIDPARIALFGSSFSGGHVQHVAAHDSSIAAVIAQAPFCDGLRNLPELGLAHVMRLTVAGLRDAVSALLGMEPYRIPAVGAPGTLAVMVTPDAVSGFAKISPLHSTWRNEVCARIALTVGLYRPGAGASRIRCPILYTIGEQDVLTPAHLAHAAARRAPRAEVKSYPCGHFDVYVAPLWDQVVTDQTSFLVKHLKLS